jgi:hypothetical protein
MNNTNLFEVSKKIANEYLQSIIFIDDEVYAPQTDQDHRLSQEEIAKYFSQEEKICAVYNPKSVSELHKLKAISKKADIVVLDWNIELTPLVTELPTDDEEEEDDDDPRGVHTISLIKDILFSEKKEINGLKVIVVYTGETGLSEHRDRIYREIIPIDNDVKKEGDYNILGNSYKIVIISKESTSKKHISEELKARIIPYAQLPEFVLNEFTSLTNGLLSNFALISLTEIRKNSGKLLTLFSKELDPAYLSHQSFIPNKEDANELLVELIKDALGNLLSYSEINKRIDEKLVNEWLTSIVLEEDISILSSKGKELNPQITYKKNIEFLQELLHSSETRVDKRYEIAFKKKITDKKIRDEYLKFLSKNNTSLFLNNSQKGLEEDINLKFAKLTHHKSLYISNDIEPKLTLGTVLRSTKNKDNFYLCIQQKCDSVRLYGLERKFLFIPLNISNNGKFQLVTSEGIKLSIDKKSFSIRTIKFNGHESDGVVKGVLQVDGSFLFTQKYIEDDDEQFSWELDLKDLHAQRIVDEYASQLSRVGLDESEWLRRWST